MKQNNFTLNRINHWAGALIITTLLVMGLYMTYLKHYQFYDLHKSIGAIAVLMIGFRLAISIRNPWQSSAQNTKHEKPVKLTHKALILSMLIMPISGVMYSGLGGYGLAVFGVEIIPEGILETSNHPELLLALSEFGQALHRYTGYLMCGLITLHIGAALKHHFINKDNTLTRMLGQAKVDIC